MEVSKKDAVQITFKCAKAEMATSIAEKIHDKLSGLEDYVESEVLLNFEGDTVHVAIGENSNKFSFITALGESVGMEAFKQNWKRRKLPKDSVIGYKPSELKQMHEF